MDTQLLFYKKAVPVTSEAHKDVSIRAAGHYGFAKEANSVPLVAAEFRAAASDCTIVFAGQGDEMMPVVILGMRDKQNLYVNEDGTWNGRYVPAFMRRYPFVFATAEDGASFTLFVDEDYEGINKNGEGEKLFDSRGERSMYLSQVLDFMREYQSQFARTRAFCQRLVEHKLLEPMHAQYTMPDGSPGRLSGFSAVNRDKLKELSGETLEKMLRSDELELLFVHLQSMNNLQPLLEKTAKAMQSDEDAPEADTKEEDAKQDA
ncbi:SapC family protein [Shimia thalassica]|uniref:SapC family protein n=1 Tax=Shimia thalassica TaxID=1715693 RepID=UPI001C080C4F|nr:SapC family protein [Shimia thalassica]MBU2941526.1 SapC family protein [Shimia thalassica]MDO6478027.1 SapC family protein [Shimia thalassica]MDO6485209.1 SapC family protein [Shimia thalassica]MDO6504093.1 SapC family protein [Shimia thalassica]MDP2494109.1 SapC family protein [Shimia thalassica]